MKKSLPFIKVGAVFNPDLPYELDGSDSPIILGEVTVHPERVENACVFIKFSEFINFTLLGLNPLIQISYRLVKETNKLVYPQILEEWDFQFESNDILEVANIETNQPTVLSFCDCLKVEYTEAITYRIEVVYIKTNHVKSFGITNKSITATVISGSSD
ncbi:DUF4489 domain-containing protein [Chengkuizengella axinellae]|uniref:DUF4489 domain-containing protein n=1 Tax=Chengkuizengella axinellae TaxID=3064388 RepID=A0ABT9J6Z3_9BACL|nr:DUF4489 domain-containing protein [Chengkuizengella sp. 2205SS18-9]MDP5276734.1 DUF4489 domain-containing protein [Chengkuizengella sp. 2205SS18-9]